MKRTLKTKFTLLIAVAFAVTLAAASSAQAVQLIGNTPLSGSSSGVNDLFSTQWNAAQFTTGATAYSLDSVILRAQHGGNASTGLAVEIYDDSNTGLAGTAGASLAALTTSDTLGAGLADMTFTAASPFVLGANTTYWVVAKGTLGLGLGNNVRVATNTNAYSGAADVLAASTDLTQYFCADGTGGCQMDPVDWLVSPGSPGGFNEMAFAVNGTAVPEPGTVMLMGTGMLGLIGWRMRKQRQMTKS